ncbi:MAG: hypothetical protein K8R59_07660, partial [Thermoanaerobaculales bacterium]|nr:hypothetical protein [Thermoanaerobaculales bacterium]
KQANYADPLSDGLVRVVAGLPENNTFVLFGSYLDARVPYQARRKALQTTITKADDSQLSEAIKRMKGQKVGAVITRSQIYLPVARDTALRFGLESRSRLAHGVWVFTSKERAPELDLRPIDLDHEVAWRLEGFADIDSPGPFGLLRPSGPEAAHGIGLAARNNLYLFDIKRGIRVVHNRWNPAYRCRLE